MKKLATAIFILLLIYGTASPQSCLPEGITFTTQEEIDNFQINNPGCTEIEGDVEIDGNNITNLNGLSVLTAIWGDLRIEYNDFLTSLSGLDNLTSIGGDLGISNNDALSSLLALDNVSSIGGVLRIYSNDALPSLSGLDNIEAGSITDLFIKVNNSLSTCEVQCICDYLITPTGTIEIHDNAPGCNSQEEVEAACTVSVESINPKDEISIFPNPANKQLTISSKDETTIEEVIIYDQIGQIVHQEKSVNNIIDISQLQPGMYIIEVVSGQRRFREKLMIE